MACNLLMYIYVDEEFKEIDLSIFNKGVVTLGKNKNNDIIINSPEVHENQLIMELSDHDSYIGDLSGQGLEYMGKLIKEKRLGINDIINIGHRKNVTLMFSQKNNVDISFHDYALNKLSSITIGSGKDNTIIYESRLVSHNHAKISRNNTGNYRIEDLDSINGIYVNSRRIKETILHNGDMINILDNIIIFHHDRLSINNIGNSTLVNNLEPYIPTEGVIKKEKPQRVQVQYPFLQRSPRFIPEIPYGDIEIEGPPIRATKPDISWLSVLLPSITMIITTLIMMVVTKGGAYVFATLGMTIVSVFISVHNYQSQLKKYKSDEEKRKKAYLDYINNIKTELQEKRFTHHKALNEIHPDFIICYDRVKNLDRKLWERTPLNGDFLNIRLGKGSEPLKGNIKIPRQEIIIDKDPLLKEPQKLVKEFGTVEDIPICASLINEGTIGIIGSRSKSLQISRNTAIQISTAHSYDEVKIISIFPEAESDEWEWMRWMPHTWDDNKQIRFMAKDKKTTHQVLTFLYDTIKMRENILRSQSDLKNRGNIQLPYLVFFLADVNLLQNEPIMNYLIHDNHHLGISSIFLFDKLELLPKDCQVVVEAASKTCQLNKRESLNSKVPFLLDKISTAEAERFARRMAPIRIKQLTSSTKLTSRLTFLDMFDIKTMNELRVKERWEKNQANKSLAVPIGKKAGNDNLILDIHEKSHGPHGLIAGTTGSGKSELIQTFILSLAVNYHPHEVAFVLIDYKGGGMANSFIGLPHLVGTITNLGGNETRRALLSIKSEIHKRQRILSEYGLNNLDQYIPLYRNKQAEIPLPHLIIIADEFAELKAEQPDFMKELVSTARVGRSLGIHLILATQKPSGVVDDQIWSNSRFKLCLKVQDASDSQEVIKRPDAAQITIPGRGFIQVGNNELFDEFQSAWSGAEYIEDIDNFGNWELKIVNLDGSKRIGTPQRNSVQQVGNSQLKEVVNFINQTAEAQGILPLPGPWLHAMPDELLLPDIIMNTQGAWNGEGWGNASSWLCPVLGIFDNPSNQEQGLLSIDLGKEGHLAVYGAPGSGKTNLLQTLITSLAISYSPEEVNVYILDFGARVMGVFSELPHVGGVVFPEEAEKLSKLSKLLLQELESRKLLFSEIGVSNLPSYLKASGKIISAMVLVIDNYSALSEMYPDIEDTLVILSREGGNYGIHLVITGNSTNAIRFKVSQNIKAAIALQMTDKGDYISIVGRTEGLEPANVVGRGLINFKPPLEIHIALPMMGENQFEMATKMRNLFEEMSRKWKGRSAKPIPILPEILTLSNLLSHIEMGENNRDNLLFLPFGLDMEDLLPVGFNLIDNHCFIISDIGYNDKSRFLKVIAGLFNDIYNWINSELYIIDAPDGALQDLAGTPKVRSFITDSLELTNLINELINELNTRKRDLNQMKRNPEVNFDESQYISNKYPLKVLLVNDLKEFIDLIDNDSKDNFERIVRFGKGLGVYIFVTGQAEEINKLSQIDTLTRAVVELQNGVILNGSFENHSFFNANIPYQERNKVLNEDEGYYINKNQFVKTKIVTI